MALPDQKVGALLDEICADFCQRRHEIKQVFLERFEQLRD